MKKILFALGTLLVSTALHALPLGNPSEASLHRNGAFWCDNCDECYDPPPECRCWWDDFSLRMGYAGDFVYDRHMQVESGSHSQIHKTKLQTNALYLALNFCNRIDLFSRLGSTKLTMNSPSRSFGPFLAAPLTLDTNSHFVWTLGLRGTLWQWGCFGVGAEAEYLSSRPTINSIHIEDVDTLYFSSRHAKYQEWQVGLGASYRINIAGCNTAAVPYMGVKWSHSRMKFGNVEAFDIFTIPNLENARKWGYAVGITLLGCNKTSITLEGRFIDEKALYVNVQLRL